MLKSMTTLPALAIGAALNTPAGWGCLALGRVRDLGIERELDGKRTDRDVLLIKFRTAEDLHRGDLAEFLSEHLDKVTQVAK